MMLAMKDVFTLSLINYCHTIIEVGKCLIHKERNTFSPEPVCVEYVRNKIFSMENVAYAAISPYNDNARRARE